MSAPKWRISDFCVQNKRKTTFSKFSLYHVELFLCLRYEVAGGIMFSGCPSVPFS